MNIVQGLLESVGYDVKQLTPFYPASTNQPNWLGDNSIGNQLSVWTGAAVT